MRLRAQLIRELAGPLPAAAQLPQGYCLELVSARQQCQHCQGPLRRTRTSIAHPVGLMLGRPHVRRVQKQCVRCGWVDSQDGYHQLVPAQANYAYDLIVEVGLARLRHLRQDAEIQQQLQQCWGVLVPQSSIAPLVDWFLDGLAALHQVHAPALRRQLEQDGGYALHLDGTCEPGTHVLFAVLAAPRRWIVHTAKMPTEESGAISNLLQRSVEDFGTPLAVMRDMSKNIREAKKTVIEPVPDLICHYHFLENVGNKLCEKPHAKLTKALRRLNLRPALRSLRKELVRASKRSKPSLSTQQIDRLLSDPDQLEKLDTVALRRLVAYVLLRWLDDYGADLRGEYFPFDLPSLALYRRGRQLGQWLQTLITGKNFPHRKFSTLVTMSRHLQSLREDAEVIAAAKRLEKAAALFEELREVLRLSCSPQQRLVRGREQAESSEQVQRIESHLQHWQEALQQRQLQETDADKRHDQKIVLNYLQTYQKELVGHVIRLPGSDQPLVVSRTNNIPEHLFGTTKRGLRRKVGTKKLTRHIQAMRSEAMLVANLEDPTYRELVCGGSLSNLPASLAEHWNVAQSIRRERRKPATDHPLPTRKKQLRQPKLFENLKKILAQLIDAAA